MFSDKDYITKTRELTAKERTRVLQELKSWKTVKVYDSQANFVLVRIEKEGITAEDLFEHAIRRKMMIRNCCTFPFASMSTSTLDRMAGKRLNSSSDKAVRPADQSPLAAKAAICVRAAASDCNKLR